MGLTLHYTGTFAKASSLEAMIEELKDVALANDWRHTVFETSFDNMDEEEQDLTVYGIILSPPDCEPVQFTFLQNRRLCSVAMIEMSRGEKKLDKYVYNVFTKTQYAGIEIHKVIVNLLRYISEKYFETFEVVDEGHYWETGDEEKLKEYFDVHTKFSDMISMGIQAIPLQENEDIESYIKRVVGKIRDN